MQVAPAFGPITTRTPSSVTLNSVHSADDQHDSDSSDAHSSFSHYYTYSSHLVVGQPTDAMHMTAANTSERPMEILPPLIKSKCESPFLLRKLSRAVLNDKWNHMPSMPIPTTYDSGVSSLSSAQMFFADISEIWQTPSHSASTSRSHCSRPTPSVSSSSLPSSNSTANSTFHYLTNKLAFIKYF